MCPLGTQTEASRLTLSFCCIQVFGCWPGSHPNREGHLFTQFEDSDANPIRKTLPDTPRVMFAPDSGGPSKMTREIDHHNTQAKTQGDPRDLGSTVSEMLPPQVLASSVSPNSNLCLPRLPTECVGCGAEMKVQALVQKLRISQ